MLAARKNQRTAVPTLPDALWMRILGFLSRPHLMRAAATCRLFAQFLAERVRESVNTCLTAAEQQWDVKVLHTFATAASLCPFWLEPLLP